MTNSFLIAIAVWFGINILFVALRLWVTRPKSRPKNRQRRNGVVSQFGVLSVKSRQHGHA